MRDCPRRREVGKVPAEGIQPVAPEDRKMSDERRVTGDESDEFDLTPPEVAVPDRLDFLAAELPPEYEGPWIVKLVRSFGGARGAGMDVLEDLFQTACAAAAKAVDDAKAEGGDVTAFVKTAVRSALAKANRRFDAFAAHVDYAEDGPRGEEANPHERLIEQFPDAKYRPSRQRKVDAVRLAALLVSPPVQAYWRAFRATGGTEREIAKYLGTYKLYVHDVLIPLAREEFKRALSLGGFVRGGLR